jgi:hypothetical protein
MHDHDWLANGGALGALGAARSPNEWLARLAELGQAAGRLANTAETVAPFRLRPPLGEIDPLAALGRAPADTTPASESAAEGAPDQGAGRPPAASGGAARSRPSAGRDALESAARARAEAPSIPAALLSAIGQGREAPAPGQPARRPAWARPGTSRPATPTQPPANGGANGHAGAAKAHAPRRLPEAARPGTASGQVAALLATLDDGGRRAGYTGRHAAAAGALLDHLASGAARALTGGEGAASRSQSVAETLAGALRAPLAAPQIGRGELARMAARTKAALTEAQPAAPGLGRATAEPRGASDRARPGETPHALPLPLPPERRAPLLPRPSGGTGRVPPGMELLGAALARYEDQPAPERPSPAEGQAPRPVAPAPAPEPPAAQSQGELPGGPAVQNTFNVTVHMGRGADEPDDDLAERLTRILVEQARRNGIDV